MEVGQLKGKFVEEKYPIRFKRKSLQAALEECQRALHSLSNCEDGTDDNDEDDDGKDEVNPQVDVRGVGLRRDEEADELRDLLKSGVQCSDFLVNLECIQVPVPENISEVSSSWDMVNANDLWQDENVDLDQEDYVLVSQEGIVEGISCFMAAYLLSLKQTKDSSFCYVPIFFTHIQHIFGHRYEDAILSPSKYMGKLEEKNYIYLKRTLTPKSE